MLVNGDLLLESTVREAGRSDPAARVTVRTGRPIGPSAGGEGSMATFVLVHGAWGGGWVWKKIVPLLRDAVFHAPAYLE